MWNVELKTLDYFSCVPAQDLYGYLTVFPQIALIIKYLWNRYKSAQGGPWHQSKAAFDVKYGAEDFELHFVYPYTWFLGI